MENLRESLKLLFLRQDCKKAVTNICEQGPSLARHIDAHWFVHEFPNTVASYGYDQKAQIYKLMREKWMCDDGQFKEMSFSSTPTIFNMLHYFTCQCLQENEGKLSCVYDSVLRWHSLSSLLSEDMLLTSYYAGKDLITGFDRGVFAWIPIIGHNNNDLNQILEQPMADLHFHLLGSSYHFDISWLSVMNHPESALGIYKKESWRPRKGEGINKYVNIDDLFILLIKACAIRRYLYHYVIGINTPEGYNHLVDCVLKQDEKGEEEKQGEEYRQATGIMSVITELQSDLNGDIEKAFHFTRDDNDKQFVVDYAINEKLVENIEKSDTRYIYTVFAGERYLMYALFQKIYKCDDDQIERIEALFYTYLIIKGLIRQEIVQLNSEIGLMNFTEYDQRKVSLNLRDYSELMKQMAIRSFCDRNPENYLEVRVQSQNNVGEIKDYIKKSDKNTNNQWFCKASEEKKLNYWYVLNFIKQKDEVSEEAASAQCRHQVLRENLKVQSKASIEWKYSEGNIEPNRVVGIDAANTECNCRPEVFSQAFRYLRHHKLLEEKPGVNDYRFTYHVGEDFFDIVDGLRAIDETIRFLEFDNKDRLGHALALGVNVKDYYRGCGQTVVMPKQFLLDNVAWLLMVGQNIEGFDDVKHQLVELFIQYYTYIYREVKDYRDHKTYIDSWYLRADDPVGYKILNNGSPEWTEATDWSEYEKAQGEIFDNARKNSEACKLNHRYHYDVGVKKRGKEAGELKLSFQMVKYIEEVQITMLEKVAAIGVSIECCPTSNLRVGPLRQYREHPIFTFNNSGLNMNELNNWKLPVSVNSDDKGIFATSLDREYSLLCCALWKDAQREITKNTPQMILDWIEMIRQNGLKLKFGAS